MRKTHDSQFDLDCAKRCTGEESKNSLVGRGKDVSWQFPSAFVSGGLHQAHSSHAFLRQSGKLLNPCRVLACGTHTGQKGDCNRFEELDRFGIDSAKFSFCKLCSYLRIISYRCVDFWTFWPQIAGCNPSKAEGMEADPTSTTCTAPFDPR